MRGNHVHLGRQDYVEPEAMSDVDRRAVAAIEVLPVAGKKTWFAAHRDGELLGFVTTRIGGQYMRQPSDADWCLAAIDWNRSDPRHGHALMALIARIAAVGEVPRG